VKTQKYKKRPIFTRILNKKKTMNHDPPCQIDYPGEVEPKYSSHGDEFASRERSCTRSIPRCHTFSPTACISYHPYRQICI